MELIITRIIENLLLPPSINFIMMFFGLFIVNRFYRTGIFLLFSGFISLIVLSMPITASFLNYPNNDITALSKSDLTKTDAKAIVILSGGRYREAPEYNQDTVSVATLARIRYGAYLNRKTKIPILVTGGIVYNKSSGASEASLMQQSLQEDFNINVKWVEENSRNTKESANLSFEMLKQENITKIILVTDFSHIKRSEAIFRKVGFDVINAPLNFDTHIEHTPLVLSLIPTAGGLHSSKSILREYMGQLWYSLRY